MQPKIKIITGYSEKGGSTVAFIRLTNYFNINNIDCTLYGPHTWHLDKCKSANISTLSVEPTDTVIFHFLQLKEKITAKKVVLSCHEKWWYNVSAVQPYCDEVVFLHEHHRNYHSTYTGKYSIIPNLKEDLLPSNKSKKELIAGIIGAIEDRKQTHISIDRAIADGCEKVFIIGHIMDNDYYNQYIKPRLSNSVLMVPYQNNKQKMYDVLGRVYHSSKGEVACLVKDECAQTNTKFFGNEETEHEVSSLTNNEILLLWKKTLEI